MIAAASLAVVLAASAPPAEPVDVWVADASAAPTIVLDVVPPGRLAALDAADATITVDGAPVSAVTDIVPQDVVVALVVDDRPEVVAPVLGASQGAAVELVRNLGAGTEVGIGTPSGIDGVPTADRAANIAVLAGLAAGAPATASVTDVLAGAASVLAASPLTDRHLVVVLGADADVDEATLGSVLAGAGIRVHVVAREDVDAVSLLRLVDATGGTAPKTPGLVASMDVVTNAIAQRLRATATIEGDDPHAVELTLGGESFAGTVDLDPDAPPPRSAAAPTTAAGAEPIITSVTSVAPSVPGTTPAAPPVTSPVTVGATDEGGGGGGSPLPIVLVLVALAAAGGVGAWIVLRRRRDELDVAPRPRPEPPPTAPTAAPPAAPAAAPLVPPPPPPPAVDEEPAAPAPEKVWGVVPPPPPVDIPESPPHLPADVSATITPPEPEPAPPVESRRSSGRPQRSPRRQRVPEAAVTVVDPTDDEWLEVGPLRLSPVRREAWSGVQQLPLTDAELNVLELLMRSQGAGVTADALTAAAKAGGDDGEGLDADQVLAQLRRKMAGRGRGPTVRKERVVMYFFGER